MYYENFETLCKIHNVKPGTVSKATGVSTATLTSWKKGVYTPKREKLEIIAKYFNVSVERITTGKDPEYGTEVARLDVLFLTLSDKQKEYALKLAELPIDKQEFIFELIDTLGKKER